MEQFKTDNFTKDLYRKLKSYLQENKAEQYREFHKKIIKPKLHIIGVRTPILRKVAKTISKGDWKGFIKVSENDVFEQVSLQGMVLNYARCPFDESLLYFNEFLNLILDWAVCDMTCCGFKSFAKNKEEGFSYAKKLLESSNPWIVRAGLVLMLAHFADEAHCDEILRCSIKACGKSSEEALKDNSDVYCITMGNAWLISVLYVKCKEKTFEFLKDCPLDNKTYNLSIQKTIESRRVSKEEKDILRSMKRKG